jgi:NMD protein affecting ribosome stability and mRNA decay
MKTLNLNDEEFNLLLSIFEKEYKRFKKSSDMSLIYEYAEVFAGVKFKFFEVNHNNMLNQIKKEVEK